MARDRANDFVVVRMGAVLSVDCRDTPGRPTIYEYADAVNRMHMLSGQFPTSVWAVVSLMAWRGPVG